MNIRKRPKRRMQVTCRCHAYPFPHRLSGGRCSGEEWAESYFYVVGTACTQCHCKSKEYGCEVAVGIESIQFCEGYQEYLHRQPALPLLYSDLDNICGFFAEEDT